MSQEETRWILGSVEGCRWNRHGVSPRGFACQSYQNPSDLPDRQDFRLTPTRILAI